MLIRAGGFMGIVFRRDSFLSSHSHFLDIVIYCTNDYFTICWWNVGIVCSVIVTQQESLKSLRNLSLFKYGFNLFHLSQRYTNRAASVLKYARVSSG